MSKDKYISDEKLAAYLERSVAEQNKSMNYDACSCYESTKKCLFDCNSLVDDSVEEDESDCSSIFSSFDNNYDIDIDDEDTREVLDISREALNLFPEDNEINITMPSWDDNTIHIDDSSRQGYAMTGFLGDDDDDDKPDF